MLWKNVSTWRAALAVVGLLLIVTDLIACAGDCAAPVERPHQRGGRTPAQQAASAVLMTVCEGVHASGAVIASGVVLTAAHVVACARQDAAIVVTDIAGREHPARILWQDKEHDLAEVITDVVALSTAPVGPPPDLGGRVCDETAWPVRGRYCGVVLSLVPIEYANGTVDIHHMLPTAFGNSGSAVYDDAGILVGVITNCNGTDCSGPVGGMAVSVQGRLP